jgi:O-antigen ligase
LNTTTVGWLAGSAMLLLAAAGWWVDVPYVLAVPVAALLAYWAFARLDLYMGVVLALVPLSINLSELGLTSVGWYMPTEPMLFALLLLSCARWLSGKRLDRTLWKHPVTWVILAGFVWMGLTILPSSHPVVSLKAWISRAWFMVAFYFLLAAWFQHSPKAQTRFLALLLVPMCIVVTYTIVRHAGHGFGKGAGHWVMKPFFKDHTSYGAVLAMLLPPAIAMVWRKHKTALARVLWGLGVVWLSVGTVLSYTRAAWVSLAAVGALWAVMKLGVRLKPLLAASVVALGGLALSWDALVVQLERNSQDSSDNFTQHIESISNVSTDDSNLERLNRWSCALAMFEERPFWGWGPGTYQFEYAPFQTSTLRTLISTNNADLGNAHSEYLGPLAEQGILGLLAVLSLLAATLHLGFKLNRTLVDPARRAWAMGLFLGIMTYFVHGVLNNFLDTDKASAPFWGFLAILVVMDIHRSKEEEKTAELT